VQCNANHTDDEINGLIAAFQALKRVMRLPSPSQAPGATARVFQKVYAYCADKIAG
jgi:hypothetical protein